MLTLIAIIGAITAWAVFSIWLMLEMFHYSSFKQAELQTKHREKDEIEC